MLNFSSPKSVARTALVAQLILLELLGVNVLAAELSAFDKGFQAGQEALKQGSASKAELAFKETLKLEEKDGATPARRAQVLLQLADLYRAQKKYAEAEPLYNQVLQTFEAKPGDELVVALNKLAGLYKMQLKGKESLQTYQRSLSIVEKKKGADSTDAATIHANI